MISLSLGVYALLKRRHTKGSTFFILLMFSVVIWTTGNALEMAAADLHTKLFWANLQYIAYCYTPVILFALCMEFGEYERFLRNKKVLLWLAVVPTIILLFVWTDGWHGLVRYNIQLDYSGSFPVIQKEYGPVFFIHAFYSYFLNISAWLLLALAVFFKQSSIYRKQAAALLLGLSFTLVPNLLYISGLSPLQRFDITSVLFAPANLIIAWGIYRFKLFDIVPVARATVIETMDVGVMVLGLHNKVLDLNPAFAKIIGCSAKETITKKADLVCSDIPELAEVCTGKNSVHKEFSIKVNELPRYYEIFVSPLINGKNVLIGRLVVTYDITEKKQAQQEYMQQQWELAVTAERERQARYMHDNLGQELGFINLQAQGIRQKLLNEGVDPVLLQLDKLVKVSQEAQNEIRRHIRNTRLPRLQETTFVSALKKETSRFEEYTGLKVNLEMPANFTGEMLKPDACVHVLYIIKEALNNIWKHAEADNVTVSVSHPRHRLSVVIEDNGKGFEPLKNNHNCGNNFGLNNMRERAAEMGGEIDIKSNTGKGSQIYLSVPVGR